MSGDFGYTEEPDIGTLLSTEVSEGKHGETLQPVVVLSIRANEAPAERFRVAMPPDAADHLAAELQRWAARAREKHWE